MDPESMVALRSLNIHPLGTNEKIIASKPVEKPIPAHFYGFFMHLVPEQKVELLSPDSWHTLSDWPNHFQQSLLVT